MSAQESLIDKQTAVRFFGAVKRFAASEEGVKGRLMFAGLIALLLAGNGMNVLNNYVGRDFMTAIENRDKAGFIRLAFVYLGVFAGSTLVTVLAKVLEDSLALLWREFITRNAVARYLDKGSYYRIESGGELENPDQRLAEDVRAFTATTLSFVVMILGSAMTILAFSGVVWSISPLLFAVAVAYAAAGSYLMFRLGRPLAHLNYAQLDRDADFRSTLLHVRENAEPLLLARREGRVSERLAERFGRVAENVRKIIVVNRNLGFFTGGYYWLIGLIPALVVAPEFMAGRVEFGVVTQSAMAFSTLVGAFSLFVTQFQSASNFAAVVSRLEDLGVALMEAPPGTGSPVRTREEPQRLVYENLSLSTPQGGCLLKDLSLALPVGARVLLPGPGAAGVALFKATAGLWADGAGTVAKPDAESLLFLAERPYLPPGTLRQVLAPTFREGEIADGELLGLLDGLGLRGLAERVGGLDEEQDWGGLLSLAEQQMLAFIHVLLRRPRMVLLDRPETALEPSQIRLLLETLAARSIGYLAVSPGAAPDGLYDAVLEIEAGGGWRFRPLA